MQDKLEAVFVQRIKADTFTYLLQVEDLEDEIQVDIIFVNQTLRKVQYDAAPADNVAAIDWKIKGLVAQLIENAERRLVDEDLPTVSPSQGDSAPGFETEVVKKEELDLGAVRKRNHPGGAASKLTLEQVVEERRYWRNPKHRDLSLNARGDFRGVTGTALAQAILGKTWKSANKIEPPLSRVEYNNALARPVKYA